MSSMKKVLCAILVLFMCFSIMPTADLVIKADAAYENTYVNTGNQRNDIIGVARTQLGYTEGYNNDTKYGNWYGLPNQPWCAMFVSWCANQAGISTSVMPKISYVPNYFDNSAFTIKYSDYTPQPGDLFITKSKSHVGLVWYTDGSYFYTIEGNSSDCVCSHRYAISSYYFAVPNYSVEANAAPTQANISINKSSLKIGEEFILTLTSDTPCNFYLSVWDYDTGERAIGENVSNTCYWSFLKPGHYHGYMSAYNSKGTKDSNWIDFYVFGDKPTTATLTADKTVLSVGESVKFTTRTDAPYVRIYTSILKGDEKVFQGDIPYTFTYTPQSEGVYRMWISAYTHEGAVDSNSVIFYVGKYNVKYNLNGGEGSIATQTKIYGQDLKLSDVKPTKTGHKFCGWATKEASDSKVVYLPGDNYKANKDITLYAVWEKEHTHSYTSSVTTQPTCTKEGVRTYKCVCGVSYTESIEKIAHTDTNSDGKCDNCGAQTGTATPTDPSKNCSCNCHKTGITKFFFTLINFFQKLFGQNKVCACGVKH